MKILIMGSLLTLFGTALQASDIHYSPTGPDAKYVSQLKKSLLKPVFGIPGVNGMGTTACEEHSGMPFFLFAEDVIPQKLFEHCIEITGETDEAVAKVQQLFPPGVRYQGVYFYAEKIGRIVPQ